WPARALRIVARGALALLVLVVALYLLRRQLVWPLLRPKAEAALAGLLQAERVTIDDVGGSWLGGIELRGVAVAGKEHAVLKALRGATLEARYALPVLLRGDLGGLLAVRLEADALALDLAGAPAPAESRASSAPFEPPDLRPLLVLARAGASVEIGS